MTPSPHHLHSTPEPRRTQAPSADQPQEPRPADQDDTCQALHVHPGKVAAARAAMASDEELLLSAELFKILSEPARLRILAALAAAVRACRAKGELTGSEVSPAGELCVCDLSALLEASPSAVSHQLRILRAARLVKTRREGKNVFYTLDDDHVETLLTQTSAHVRENR